MKNILPDASDEEFLAILREARQGGQDAVALLIERYRPYLLKIANGETDERFKAKEGDSDLVQDTCWRASRVFAHFKGESPEQLRGWLRKILRRRIGEQRDHYRAEKRDIAAEVRLQNVDSGDSRNEKLATDSFSPSEHLVRKEELDIVEQAMLELRERDRHIIELRQMEGYDFAEIAKRLNLTEDAAQKRWIRALDSLKEIVERLQ